jgi:catechol 2,3-dioxygenase-like lactoylglutathione lyase family enzyme
MAVEGVDHYTILTKDLAATRHFYCDLLGLSEGWRPPFSFPGLWLYAGGHPVVHIIAGRPIPGNGDGTGAVDHVAFKAAGDVGTLQKKLEAEGFQVSSRIVPNSGIRQLFCRDPSGVQVELNYPPA